MFRICSRVSWWWIFIPCVCLRRIPSHISRRISRNPAGNRISSWSDFISRCRRVPPTRAPVLLRSIACGLARASAT
ncbi:hypothetical protein F5Y14DRAFT_131759 [Nemania sp. NC0429]|nr:hypothetical protein F5Y14DRAFT_131759 [Nemania sp. NC0429]